MSPQDANSWRKGIAPCLGITAFTVVLLVFTWKQGDSLNAWAAEPHVTYNLLGFLLYGACVLLGLRTYAQVRNPRLYALVFLMVPIGVVHFFHYSNSPQGTQGKASSEEPGLTVSKVPSGGTFPSRPGPVREDPPRSATFVGLPDSIAKSNPELPAQLNRLFERLYSYTFLVFPLLVIAATPLSFRLTSRHVRMASLLFLLGEFSLGALILVFGPETLGNLPSAPTVLIGVTLCAATAAFVFWRSPAGVGGAVAGLLLYMLPAGLSNAGLDPSDIGLDLKRLPIGPERALVMGFSLVLTYALGREWVVSMKHTTQTDALTQIFNKAYAEGILNQTGGTDLGAIYSVALLDIDHFKKVNDTHGHFAGDEVLREVCKTIQQTIDNRGLVCRTGGEEITVFFPGLDSEETSSICEEVREAVQDLKIPTNNNDGKKVTLNVTISLGVATNADIESGEKLHPGVRKVVEAADRAVYAAKASGRNRVVLDG